MKIAITYTIFISHMSETRTLTILFGEDNAPKDILGHHNAVEDFLIDTNPYLFQSIADFKIIRMLKW